MLRFYCIILIILQSEESTYVHTHKPINERGVEHFLMLFFGICAGTDGYQQMVAVGGWGQGYVGDMPHQSVLCPPPPAQGYPPLLREPSPLPYPPFPFVSWINSL